MPFIAPLLRRIVAFLAPSRPGLIIGAALLAAWWLYPRPGRDSEAGPAPVEEIVFWMPGGTVSDVMRVGVEAFEQRNPNVRVLMGAATVRDATGDPTRFLLGVAGDEPPDLIYFDRFAVVEWARHGPARRRARIELLRAGLERSALSGAALRGAQLG
jgi:ABC-type glycerol-3-phosphate transport system substrate-binding protein